MWNKNSVKNVNWLKAYQLGINNNMVTESNLYIQAKIQLVRRVQEHESRILDNIVKSSTLSDLREQAQPSCLLFIQLIISILIQDFFYYFP